jgi:hypothetical protein
MTGTLRENQYTFLIISRSVLLKMKKMFQTKVLEKLETHILYSIIVFENRAVYDMWKNNV